MRRSGTAVLATILLAFPGPLPAETVEGDGRTLLASCDAGEAVVTGDGNRVVFQGPCRVLRIAGSANQVELDLQPGGTIEIAGADNHVLHVPVEPPPQVILVGPRNRVEPGTAGPASAALVPALPDAPPAPPALPSPRATTDGAARALVLDGERQTVDVACAGRDVLIHGSQGRYTLRGGCRSVMVQGRANRIEAELQPGARIAIGGDAVMLDYVLAGDGPAPVLSVTGTGSRATRVPRLGATPAEPPPSR